MDPSRGSVSCSRQERARRVVRCVRVAAGDGAVEAKATSGGEDEEEAEEEGKYRYKLVVAYDGGAYYGWQLQRQAKQRSVQEQLESAVISFSTNRIFPDEAQLQRALDSLVPSDISVKSAARVPPDFSARYCSLRKVYRYRIHTAPAADPFSRHFALHFPYPLDTDLMAATAQDFLGTHDFTQFSNNSGAEPWARPDPVKTIHRCDVRRDGDEGELCLEVEGSGFLHRMVRHMAGALLAVANGRLPRERIAAALSEGRDAVAEEGRFRGWSAAPAHGLTLHKVVYPPHDDPSQLMFPGLPHDEHGRLAHVSFTWERQPDGSYRPTLPADHPASGQLTL